MGLNANFFYEEPKILLLYIEWEDNVGAKKNKECMARERINSNMKQ